MVAGFLVFGGQECCYLFTSLQHHMSHMQWQDKAAAKAKDKVECK